MRNLLLLLLITSYSFSQEKCDFIHIDKNEFTKETIITTDTIQLDDFYFYIKIGAKKSTFPKVIFKTNIEQCVDYLDNIYLLLENDSSIKSGNYVYEYNCNGYSGFIINTKKTKKIKDIKVVGIRIETSSNIYENRLTEEQSELFLDMVQCTFNREEWE